KLWGIRKYNADRHDPLIRTTIHRLRAFLEPHGAWICVTDDGYATTVPVHFVGAPVPTELETFLVEDEVEGDELLATTPEATATIGPSKPPPAAPVPASEALSRAALIRRHLVQLRKASVRELARASGLSQSTVLRALRELMASRKVQRIGSA